MTASETPTSVRDPAISVRDAKASDLQARKEFVLDQPRGAGATTAVGPEPARTNAAAYRFGIGVFSPYALWLGTSPVAAGAVRGVGRGISRGTGGPF